MINAFYPSLSENRWCIIIIIIVKKCGYSSSKVDDAPYVPKSCPKCHQSKQPITCTCCHYHRSVDPFNVTKRTF